jgi:hypothetical protein
MVSILMMDMENRRVHILEAFAFLRLVQKTVYIIKEMQIVQMGFVYKSMNFNSSPCWMEFKR